MNSQVASVPASLNNRLVSPLQRITFAICPTGLYCREDRCQSFFSFELIPSVRAPLEECEAAGAIRAAGGSAVIIDAPVEGLSEAGLIKRIRQSKPDAIVIVATFGTLDADLKWADTFRLEFPDVAIGIRGAPCYTSEEEIFQKSSSIDFSVKGEYELIFQALCTFGVYGTPGVSYRGGDSRFISEAGPLAKNLDALPLPDRSTISSHKYRVRGLGGRQATVRVQRGCPFPCSYCLVHLVSGKTARHRSPVHIVGEVRSLMDSGTRSFYLRADTFTLDREWVVALCKELKEKCHGIRWVTTTRVDKVDDDLVRLMREAGCYGISFGVDVASHTIGKKVSKLADLEVTKRALKACDRAGVLSLVYVMIGFIWETSSTLDEAKVFLQGIRPDLLTVHFAHPYPGTRYHQDVLNAQSLVLSKRAQAEPATEGDGVTDDMLRKAAKGILVRHYLRLSVVWSILKKVITAKIRNQLNRMRPFNRGPSFPH